MNNKNVYGLIIGTISLLIGFWIGVSYVGSHSTSTNESVREKDTKYKFISPLLFTDNMNPDTKSHSVLNTHLNSYIKDTIAKKQATQVSVYFRDLNTSKWLGVNENEQYEPASLLKLALLISYVRSAEINPGILDEKLKASQDSFNFDSVQNYKPKDPVQIGKVYTVRSLLSSLIVNSDNDALALLSHNISSSSVNILYKDLQIPVTNGEVSNISPAVYSRFFRILYNSSYLSHPVSEAVLGLLSQTDFSVGLVAGVPVGTVVSHKFGENKKGDSAESMIKELHDCGIVYYPEHPYFICVMTRGKDFKSLENVISSISKIVWDNVGG